MIKQIDISGADQKKEQGEKKEKIVADGFEMNHLPKKKEEGRRRKKEMQMGETTRCARHRAVVLTHWHLPQTTRHPPHSTSKHRTPTTNHTNSQVPRRQTPRRAPALSINRLHSPHQTPEPTPDNSPAPTRASSSSPHPPSYHLLRRCHQSQPPTPPHHPSLRR